MIGRLSTSRGQFPDATQDEPRREASLLADPPFVASLSSVVGARRQPEAEVPF